jgi:hypothetical protein
MVYAKYIVVSILVSSIVATSPTVAFATPKWSVQSTAKPTGTKKTELYGVSCTESKWCLAVGTYTNSSGTQVTLAELWNGTEWKVQSTPNPTGAKASELRGVSCREPGNTGPDECDAVGWYTNSSGKRVTLAEFFNTVSWSVVTTPNPTGATSSELAGVSCTDGGSGGCFAVGSYANSSGVRVTLAMLSTSPNQEKWTIQTTPNPSESTGSELLGVSCLRGESCYAVGAYSKGGRLTLAEHWNGKEWSIQSTEDVGSDDILLGDSCPSTCTAVGAYSNSLFVQVTLAEQAGTIQETPNPVGAEASVLHGVSCVSETACIAVGDYISEKENLTLAEDWNGTKWSLQETPNPETTTFNALLGVSCVEAALCTAVGYSDSGSNIPLAERYM